MLPRWISGGAPIHHKMLKTHSLKKVVAVVRHGSRSPCQGGVECWPGYQPTLEGLRRGQPRGPRAARAGLSAHGQDLIPKDFGGGAGGFPSWRTMEPGDQRPLLLGPALPEGFEQHQSNGQALRAAYVGSGAEVGTLVGEGEVLGDRTLPPPSDLPRTVASGQASSRPPGRRRPLPLRPGGSPGLASGYLCSTPKPARGSPSGGTRSSPARRTRPGGPRARGTRRASEDRGRRAAKELPAAPSKVAEEFTQRVGGAFPWGLSDLEGPTLDCVMANQCSEAGLPAPVFDPPSWSPFLLVFIFLLVLVAALFFLLFVVVQWWRWRWRRQSTEGHGGGDLPASSSCRRSRRPGRASPWRRSPTTSAASSHHLPLLLLLLLLLPPLLLHLRGTRPRTSRASASSPPTTRRSTP